MSDAMVIDIHAHTFPAAMAAATVEKLGRIAKIAPYTDGTERGLKASMEKAGVDVSVLLPVATRPEQVGRINDRAAAICARQEGLLSFAAMHPDCEKWKEELDRAAAMGLKGVKIHPVYQNTEQNDPRYLRILDRAGELGLMVVTHGGIDIGYPGAAHCAPGKIASALRQVGPVTLVAAHIGGWCQWDEALCLAEFPNAYLDTSFSVGTLASLPGEETRQLLDEPQFLKLVRSFGSQRILFGTDSPWSDQKGSIAWIRALPLAPEEKTAILGGNAAKLLGL